MKCFYRGGKYDAYGGGTTYDPWGKKFFKNGPVSVDDEWHVAIVTPVRFLFEVENMVLHDFDLSLCILRSFITPWAVRKLMLMVPFFVRSPLKCRTPAPASS